MKAEGSVSFGSLGIGQTGPRPRFNTEKPLIFQLSCAKKVATIPTSDQIININTMASPAVTNNKIRDENDASAAEAASSIAAATLKAYVPSGDQRLVLSAIDNQLNLAKESWKQRNGCSSSSGSRGGGSGRVRS